MSTAAGRGDAGPGSGPEAVLERGLIAVQPGREPEFEAAFAQAKLVIVESPGFCWLELHRGVERPDTYLLLVCWESLQAHTVGFRGSDRFVRWRELIGPFFAGAPDVEHYVPVVVR